MKIYDELGLVVIFICALFRECLSLKEVCIHVPPAVVQGHEATLKCIFDLEGDKLYSVKWYRGAGEFYRYTPSDINPIKQFRIKGFHVIESKSNATQVVLRHVTRAISGKFSCEVTADQPSFFTDMKTAKLEVIELPKTDPYITGLHARYKIGEFLKANCTSEKSNPAANLTWFVNGRLVDRPHVVRNRIVDENHVSSISTIRFKITEHYFHHGRLKLRCSASMHDLYYKSSEKSIELEKRKPKNAYGWTPPNTSTEPENWQFGARNSQESTLIFEETPISVGDQVTSRKAIIICSMIVFLICYT